MPNYFGLQRFGFEGSNVHGAREYAERQELPVQRNLRSRLLSAGRSYLFNRVLAERVGNESWNQAQVGDLLAFTDSRSFFPAGEAECQDPRLAILDLHPTGPLWGAGESPASGEVQVLEAEVVAAEPAIAKWLAEAGMKHERRILRLPIGGLSWHYPGPDILQLEFGRPECFIAATSAGSLLSSPGSFPGLPSILGSRRHRNNCPQYRFTSFLGSNTHPKSRKSLL